MVKRSGRREEGCRRWSGEKRKRWREGGRGGDGGVVRWQLGREAIVERVERKRQKNIREEEECREKGWIKKER